MIKSLATIVGLLAVVVSSSLLNSGGDLLVAASTGGQELLPAATASPELQVTLSAAQATTSWDSRDPARPAFDLPLLYLHRQREAAAQADRTLDLSLTGFAAGTRIVAEVVSRHVDRSTGERHTATTDILLPDRPCTPEDPCAVHWTFDAATMLSDFYSLRVKDGAGQLLWSNPSPERPDLVVLDTWDVAIGEYTIRTYYATLFRFARGHTDLDNRLAPSSVPDFIEYVFVPMIVDTWHTQFEVWGFGDPIHPQWDRDNVVEIIVNDPPFALFGISGTCTAYARRNGTLYPERRIWWLSSHDSFYSYDLLPNAYKAVFAHEFFHIVQWNALLPTGRPTNYATNLFLEAQGRFAPSVQYPDMEIGQRHVVRGDSAFGRAANLYPLHRTNSSYSDMEMEGTYKYDLALYWRFLYEQFGDVNVIRVALEEMALNLEPDVVASMPRIMDRVFARFDGPLHAFEDSLIAFSRAVYALRLDNGRCTARDLAECGGYLFDPRGMYVPPPIEAELAFDGTPLAYAGAIPVSYGMDFVEIEVDAALRGRPIAIRFRGEGAVARYSVQLWRLVAGDGKPRAVTPEPETIPRTVDGTHDYVIPAVDTMAYDRLALIITRLDAGETADPAGNYRVTLAVAQQAFD